MSTHANIIRRLPSNVFECIYLHWDGDSALETLQKHYTDPAKIEALFALGDLSELGEEIGKRHLFEWRDGVPNWQELPEAKWCLAYGRDRGDPNAAAGRAPTLRTVLSDEDAVHHYLFEDGKWKQIYREQDFEHLMLDGSGFYEEIRL